MEANVSVDIGQNLTTLIEKLANAIGIAVDKIYPMYVQQAYNEGLTTLIVVGAIGFVVVTATIVSAIMADWKDGNPATVVFLISMLCLLLLCLIGGVGGVEGARQVMNPDYYATRQLISDMAKFKP